MTVGHGNDTERSAENAIARIWAKEGTRILIAVIAFLGSIAWNGIKTDVQGVKSEQAEQGAKITSMQSDVRSINDRLDAGLVKQVDGNTKRIDAIEQRVSTLERTVPVR